VPIAVIIGALAAGIDPIMSSSGYDTVHAELLGQLGLSVLGPVGLAYPDEILRTIADRMAHIRLGVLPVVDRADAAKFVGLVTQFDLLDARQKLLEEERKAERMLLVRRPAGQNLQKVQDVLEIQDVHDAVAELPD
jgi:hypothetical protein